MNTPQSHCMLGRNMQCSWPTFNVPDTKACLQHINQNLQHNERSKTFSTTQKKSPSSCWNQSVRICGSSVATL